MTYLPWCRYGISSLIDNSLISRPLRTTASQLSSDGQHLPTETSEPDQVEFIAVAPEVRTHLSSPLGKLVGPASSGAGKRAPAAPAGATSPPAQPLASQLELAGSSTTAPVKAHGQQDTFSLLYLDNSTPLEVYAYQGSSAYLLCRLRSFQPQEGLQVSWFQNVQILTSGEHRYTSDERFKPKHLAGSLDWQLHISEVRAEDEGEYECRVNSSPKSASATVFLHVLSPQIHMLDKQQTHQVALGAQISLTCRLEYGRPNRASDLDLLESESDRISLAEKLYIFWYKDGLVLSQNTKRARITFREQHYLDYQEKQVVIEDARPSDQGEYTCKVVPMLSENLSASTRVQVGSSFSTASSSSSRHSSSRCRPFSMAILSASLSLAILRLGTFASLLNIFISLS